MIRRPFEVDVSATSPEDIRAGIFRATVRIHDPTMARAIMQRMGDSRSASLFGELFRYVAKEIPSGQVRSDLSRFLWGLQKEYDFMDEEMDADAELIKLDLARKKDLPRDHPQGEGLVMFYGPPGKDAP